MNLLALLLLLAGAAVLPVLPAQSSPAPGKAPASRPDEPAVPPAGDAREEAEAAKRTPQQIEARSLAHEALARFEKGEWKRADALAEKATALDGAYELPWRIRGWCCVALGDDAPATLFLTEALNRAPANTELQLLLASCHRRLGEWGAAKDLLGDLLKKSGGTVPLFLELAECCIGEEDWTGALAVLAQARALAPSEREVVTLVVTVHEKREAWAEAVAELRPLLTATPGDVPLRWRLIQALLNGRKFQDGAAELEEAARVWGDDPRPHQVLADLYRRLLPDPERAARHEAWLKEWNLRRR